MNSAIPTVFTKLQTINTPNFTCDFTTAIAVHTILTLFTSKTRLIFQIGSKTTANHTLRSAAIMNRQIGIAPTVTIRSMNLFGINISRKTHPMIIQTPKVIIHGSILKIQIEIIFVIRQVIHMNFLAIKTKRNDILILPIQTFSSQLFKPLNDLQTQILIMIRIVLNTGNDIMVNNKQLTPLLTIPIVIANTHTIITRQICNYHASGVHHFHSTLTITTFIFPRHTAFPTISVVAHSHIVKRMNGNSQLTAKVFLVQNLGVTDSEIFPTR